MSRLRTGLALWLALIGGSCALPPLETLSQCNYAAQPGEERVFVLPSIEEAVGGGTAIYAEPKGDARIRLSSFAYAEELAGKRYKRLEEIAAEDGDYVRWLLEDCRVFYTRSGEQ